MGIGLVKEHKLAHYEIAKYHIIVFPDDFIRSFDGYQAID